MTIWRRFIDGKPEHLVRHYWWGYLWPVGVAYAYTVIIAGGWKTKPSKRRC